MTPDPQEAATHVTTLVWLNTVGTEGIHFGDRTGSELPHGFFAKAIPLGNWIGPFPSRESARHLEFNRRGDPRVCV